MPTLSRRAALAGMASAMAPVARGQTLRKATITLPFLAEGSNAFVFVAKAGGFWRALGLDVEIARGAGSTSAVQAVGAGRFDFGVAMASSVIEQVAKGLALVAVAATSYDSTMGLCVMKDGPIQSLKDLAGRNLGSSPASGEYPFLPAVAQQAGLDLKSVNLVQVDPNVRQRALTSGRLDAFSGLAISYLPPMLSQSFGVRSIPYSQYGLSFYNLAVFTRHALLRDEPDFCAAMVTGLMQAVRFTLLNPDEAARMFTQLVPETALSASGLEQLRLGIGIFRLGVLRDLARQHALGYSAPEDYTAMTEVVRQYVTPSDPAPKVDDLVTNALVGGVGLSEAEWSQAAALAAPFKQVLG